MIMSVAVLTGNTLTNVFPVRDDSNGPRHGNFTLSHTARSPLGRLPLQRSTIHGSRGQEDQPCPNHNPPNPTNDAPHHSIAQENGVGDRAAADGGCGSGRRLLFVHAVLVLTKDGKNNLRPGYNGLLPLVFPPCFSLAFRFPSFTSNHATIAHDAK